MECCNIGFDNNCFWCIDFDNGCGKYGIYSVYHNKLSGSRNTRKARGGSSA